MSISQLGQDKRVIQFYKRKRRGFFVEVGASDGLALSNTYLLERDYEWTGICVEPIPAQYKKLVANRPRSICSSNAVYNESGLTVKFDIAHNFDLLSGIQSCIDSHKGEVDANKTTIDVVTISLTDLLDSSKAPTFIEYLSLDTEGSEYEILRTFNFDKYKFGWIDVEHNGMEPRRTQIRTLLTSKGYVYEGPNRHDDMYRYASVVTAVTAVTAVAAEPVIVLAPNSGFCNRLDFMSRAVKYAAIVKRPLYHLWDGAYHKRSVFPHEQQISDRSFSHFFNSPLKAFNSDQSAVSVAYSFWMPGHFWYESHSYGSKQLRITDLRPHSAIPTGPVNESFLIQGSVDQEITQEEQHEIYKTYFKPTELFCTQLESFKEPPTGVHIRKVDFCCYFKEAFVPDDATFSWLEQLDGPVLLFSDDKEFQAEARKRLKCPISCTFETKVHPPEDMAFLEFLTMSRCSALYGTLKSSFSKQAAIYGNIPYTAITEELVTV